jgi:nitrite reductase/ring-hydroxylating ferredoxin subunit
MPFFSRKKMSADADGYYATGIDPTEVREDEMVTARVGGEIAIISRAHGELVAFSNICPHAAADLRQGRLARGQIKCHEHGYTFDLRSGRATWPEGEGCRLLRFDVRVSDGLITLRPAWQPAGGA